jgi:hypothetical protein
MCAEQTLLFYANAMIVDAGMQDVQRGLPSPKDLVHLVSLMAIQKLGITFHGVQSQHGNCTALTYRITTASGDFDATECPRE